MEQINAVSTIGNKGLYSPDMFRGGLPRGRKGKKIVEEVPEGIMTHKLGAFVGTREFTVAVLLVSNYLSTKGLNESKTDFIKDDFKIWSDKKDAVGNTEVERTTIVFDFREFVEHIGYGKEPKLIRDAFDALEMIHSSFENNKNLFDKKKRISNVSSFSGFSLNNGRAKIEISNLMLGLLIGTVRSIRIENVIKYIKYKGIVSELSLFVEYNQGSRNSRGSLPRQTYNLKDIMEAIPAVSDKVKKKQGEPYIIKTIQEAFDILAETQENFPRFIYSSTDKFFYSKYKKGADQGLFRDEISSES